MIDRTAAAFLCGSILFSTLVIWELVSGDDKTTIAAEPTAQRTETPRAQGAPPPSTGQLIAVALAKPLFSATRRPSENQPDRAADTPLTNLRLTGILIGQNERLAIFAVTGGKPLVGSEGETISEWRIDSIAPHAVSLIGPAGVLSLEPKPDGNLVRPRPAGPAAPPVQPIASRSNSPSAADGAPNPSAAPVRRSSR